MKLDNYIILIFIIYSLPIDLFGQIDTTLITTLEGQDSLIQEVTQDSLIQELATDTIPKRSTLQKPKRLEEVKFTKDPIEAPIKYGAKDTQWYDHKNTTMHLYGNAFVEYEGKKLEAGYIAFDMKNNIASAFSIKDNQGHILQQPVFSDGEKNYTYDKLKYNFKTEKGIVYDAITSEGDLFIHGHKTKFVAGGSDSIQESDIVYNQNALITSCNHPNPHFGVRSKKMKLISDKVAVVGPSNLEIAGVPTPLWIPFGFFPLTDGESTGFLFPEDFNYSASRGFGILGVGWYFPLNDYINLTVRGDFYTNGSNGVRVASQYKKKYKYDGNISIAYNLFRSENSIDAFNENQFDYLFRVTHSQNSKAHPYRKIGGDINITGTGYDRATRTDASSQLTQIRRSNFSYSHSLPGTPFQMSVALNHSQNVGTGEIDLTLPNIQLRMNTIYPFKRKNASSTDERWYEKVTFKYNTEIRNYIEAQDSIGLFDSTTLENMRSGVSHSASSDLSLRFLKYFDFNPNIRYDEDWVFRVLEKQVVSVQDSILSDTTLLINDMVIPGTYYRKFTNNDIENIYNNQFKAYRNYNIGANLSTSLFVSLPATKGWFRGWRMPLRPSVNLSYSPSTIDRYELELVTGIESLEDVRYSPFEASAISIPSLAEERLNIGYNINGPMEMKYYSKRDSIEKKFKIFDGISLGGSYNFAKDSLNFTKLTGRATTRLFKGKTTLTYGYGFDVYQEDEKGIQIARLVKEDKRFPLRLDDGFIKMSTSLKFGDIINIFKKKSPDSIDSDDDKIKDNKYDTRRNEHMSIMDWVKNLRLDYDIQYNYITTGEEKEFLLNTHSIRFSGQVPLTENWSLNIGNFSYDFKNKSFVYPQFALSRDLHCWSMNIGWAPSQETYSFFIGVSSSSLNFLKYNYGQDQFDGLINGGVF